MNFPVQLTSFIGREREIVDVKHLLLDSHLVTLTGAGGSGKTRLAIQIAHSVSENYPDGVCMVDLAPLRESELVPQLAAQALGLHLSVDEPPLETLLNSVRSKKMLLILDNCEHLIVACAQLGQELLSQTPELRILATSSIPLAIAGEAIYPVPGLDWPVLDGVVVRDEKNRLDLHKLIGYDAVRLFVERARALSPKFDLTLENAWSIIEICQRLDGLPLALELASARVNVLTVQEIATRLNDRLALLISYQRTGIEPRHQTLRAAIDWSFTLLPMDEQILLRRLAVFEAGCTLDTAEAICTDDGMSDSRTLDRISSLVRKSLVVADIIGRTQARYRLLETIREYALSKLDEAGETKQLRDRHLDLFLARSEETAPKLGEAYQQLWLNWLESEHDNLRSALAWSLESGRIEAGLRIASALVRFWEIRGFVQEGLEWFERLFTHMDEEIPPRVRVNALVFASFLEMFLGNGPTAMVYGRKAVDLAAAVCAEDRDILAFALGGLASGARAAGDYQTALSVGEQAIEHLRALPVSSFNLAMSLLATGEIAIQMGSYDRAREWLDESLVLARQDGDAFRIAHTLNALGDLYRLEQNYVEATRVYENGVALLRELGAQHDLASILSNLGYTCLHLGDVERARSLFAESMSIHQAQQNKPGMSECLIGCAATAVMGGLPAVGVRLLTAAAVISGQPSASQWRATRMEYERYLNLARFKLPLADFQAEQAIGSAVSLEQAVTYAQKLVFKPETPLVVPGTPDGLTGREREIATLIGQGKSNSEIATELVVSKRTVETHVSHILAKLGLSNRAQVMRWAIDHGLTQTRT